MEACKLWGSAESRISSGLCATVIERSLLTGSVVLSTAEQARIAASQTSTKSSSIVQILHLVFTILSIAALSYKVYHVESELSFIRHELSFRDDNNGMTVQLSTAATVNKHSRDRRSDGKSRVSHKTSKETAADCIQKALSEFQVGLSLLNFLKSPQLIFFKKISLRCQ